MELRHLRYFAAVAEEGSFSRAAERLGIQQPPLSAQIRQLENEVGVTLLRRLSRAVELTPAGKLFLEHCRAILGRVEQARLDATREARGESGQICFGGDGACYFNPVLHLVVSELLGTYPSVITAAEEADTDAVFAGLHAGKFDAAFMRDPADVEEFGSILVDEEDSVAVLPREAAPHSSGVTLQWFARQKLVMPWRGACSGYYDAVFEAFRQAGVVPSLAHPVAPSAIAVLPMVAAGYGASIVPASFARMQLDGVVYAPISGIRPPATVRMLHRRGDHSPVVRNVVSIIRRLGRRSARIAVDQGADAPGASS